MTNFAEIISCLIDPIHRNVTLKLPYINISSKSVDNVDTIDVDKYISLLMETAQKDGIVTDHEKMMITKIVKDLEFYSKMLDQALDDGIINVEEKARLYTFRTNMFSDNLRFVNLDKKVSNEEKEILKILGKMLSEIGDFENKFSNYT